MSPEIWEAETGTKRLSKESSHSNMYPPGLVCQLFFVLFITLLVPAKYLENEREVHDALVFLHTGLPTCCFVYLWAGGFNEVRLVQNHSISYHVISHLAYHMVSDRPTAHQLVSYILMFH